jgi:hypothetical protein
MPSYNRFGRMYPSLTPTSGLGSYGRTGAAILISQPRNSIASQNRIYGYYRNRGLGPFYINLLRQAIGPQPYVNPFTLI